MKKLSAILALGISVAFAAALAATVTWTAPTTNTDGSTISGPITYQLYVGPKGAEVKYKTPVTSPPYVLVPTPPAGTQVCVEVTATVNAVESAPSAEVCTNIPAPTPNPPSNVKVVVQ